MEQLPTEHQSTVRNLREDNDFADVTLVYEDCQLVEAQKVNLVASSPPGIEKNMNLFCNLCKEICVSKTGFSNHLNIVHKLSKEQIKSSLHISIEIVEIEDDEEQEIQIITIDVDLIQGIHEDKDQEMAIDVSQSSIHPSEQELSGLLFGRAPGPPDPKNKYEEIMLQLKKLKVHCEQCGKEFGTEHTLKRHIVTKHNEMKYDCTKM